MLLAAKLITGARRKAKRQPSVAHKSPERSVWRPFALAIRPDCRSVGKFTLPRIYAWP